MRRTALVLLLFATACGAPKRESGRATISHVVLVSIDGLRPDFYLGDFDAPALKAMAREGVSAREALSVYPSSTYPAHASIVTGVRPWKHGIVANTTWSEEGATRDWHWHAKDIRARTLWQAAREKGRTTGIVWWPSSVGAEADWVLAEIWDPAGRDSLARMIAGSTPGLLLELGLAVGVPPGSIVGDRPAIDRFVARAAAFLLERRRPNLLLVHLINVDEVQHREGRDGPSLREAVKAADGHVARLREAVARAGLADRTLFIVTGDHGFVDVGRNLHPNTLLRDAGYVTAEGGRVTAWRALAHSSGGSCAIRVKDPADVPAVAALFRRHAGREGRAMYDVLERPALDAMGQGREASLALDARDDWAFSGAIADRFVEGTPPTVKANHGQRPDRPGLATGFVAAGPGVKSGAVLDRVRLIDVAPTVARALGLAMGEVEGSPILEAAP